MSYEDSCTFFDDLERYDDVKTTTVAKPMAPTYLSCRDKLLKRSRVSLIMGCTLSIIFKEK